MEEITYYTARLVQTSPVKVEVCKWDGSVKPENIYIVYPSTNSCSCVATKRECKHVQLAKDLLDPEFVNEMHAWTWSEETGWIAAHDLPIEEFSDALLAR
jgi:hypothetical protein